ncbi:hypothetical protein NGB58_25785 [Escherichia coli]|nr:hypothetical protein [Escherichia coli]
MKKLTDIKSNIPPLYVRKNLLFNLTGFKQNPLFYPKKRFKILLEVRGGILLAIFCILLISCADSVSSDYEQDAGSVKLCKGVDCSKYPDSGYKPTKEERTRVMKGEKPDFGSEKKGVEISF